MGLWAKLLYIGVIVACAAVVGLVLIGRSEGEDIVLSSIRASGYQGELHHTTTEDGYILGLHRILKGSDAEKKEKKETKIPVLFVHGLESSAADWIYYQGNESLPYLLLEEGYDVWLGNVRGTRDSYKHVSLDPVKDYEKYWNSSFHEIGYYDLPAMIDYVLTKGNNKKLMYVGMSQGEATFLVMASTRPEYNKKIILASLTSPSSHLRYSDNTVLKTLGDVWPHVQKLSSSVGLHTVPARNMLGTFCRFEISSYFCDIITNPFLGYYDDNQERDDTSKLFRVYPVRSALKQAIHYMQMYNSGIFRRFDYGEEGNLKEYGTKEPPEYEMNKVTAPVAYFWGENDCWSRPKDMEEIEAKLPNLVLSYKTPQAFNHYDILVAKNAKEMVYKKMIETIAWYSKNA